MTTQPPEGSSSSRSAAAVSSSTHSETGKISDAADTREATLPADNPPAASAPTTSACSKGCCGQAKQPVAGGKEASSPLTAKATASSGGGNPESLHSARTSPAPQEQDEGAAATSGRRADMPNTGGPGPAPRSACAKGCCGTGKQQPRPAMGPPQS